MFYSKKILLSFNIEVFSPDFEANASKAALYDVATQVKHVQVLGMEFKERNTVHLRYGREKECLELLPV